MVDRMKKHINSILEECITEGSTYYNLCYYAKDFQEILDELFYHMEYALEPNSKKENFNEVLFERFEKFLRDYKTKKNFGTASQQFIDSFQWREERLEYVYTKIPVPHEGTYDTIESIVDELNKTKAYTSMHEIINIWRSDDFIELDGIRPHNKEIEPLRAIEAFLFTYQYGLYPPVWVLDYMAHIFKMFHNSLGLESLDKLFGFRKGAGGPFQKILETQRDEKICHNIAYLEELLGVDREKACKLEAERLLSEDKNGNRTSLRFNIALSWETLLDKYRKKWARVYADIFSLRDRRDETWREKWKAENSKEFISHYPSLNKKKKRQ